MDKENLTIKLLLVDDEEDFRRATATALSRRGFTVTDAANGDVLVGILRERDIVLEIAKVMEVK